MRKKSKFAAEKIERERHFHNARFSQVTDPRAHLNKWYTSVRHGAERQNKLICEYATNKDALECGCADGALSMYELDLAARCSTLTGIDISDVAIEKANHAVAARGLQNARFFTMNAEAMTFPDQSFDLIFGRGILHHLDLQKCYGELSRVLRKDGYAIFSEPLGHNPLVNLYRGTTPNVRTKDEHPLLMSDLKLAHQYFAQVDTRFYGFLSVASVLLDPSATRLPYRLSKALDDMLLSLPFLGRYAWHCLIIFRK